MRAIVRNHKADLAALRKGVKTIASPGVPGALVVFGHNAFPVAAGTSGAVKDPVAAAATWGKGRVLIYSHGGYIGNNDLKYKTTGQLLQNAVNWLAYGTLPSSQKQKIAVVGAISLTYLQQQKYDVTQLGKDWSTQLGGYQVLLIKANHLTTATLRQTVLQFVTDGGGFVDGRNGLGLGTTQPQKRDCQ